MSALRHPRLLPLVCGLTVLALAPSANAQTPGTSTKMVCTNGTLTAGTRSFTLRTGTGRISMPEGGSVFMWGIGNGSDSFQMPGPVLCANQGETVQITLNNTLPEPTSLIFPGQAGVSATGGASDGLFAREAATGGSVVYSFSASQPGTYLYESGTNPHKQVHMGLYGALVVRPTMDTATTKFAYNDAATRYDPNREYLILMHDIDPALHQAVERNQTYDVTLKHDAYWTINGRSFPDTIANNNASWLPQQPYSSLVSVMPFNATNNPLPALVRYANAGFENHPFHPHGNHFKLVAQDGRVLRGTAGEDVSMEAFTRTVGAGQTYDLLFSWRNADLFDPRPYPTGNPVPVPLPSNRNLTFKDSASYYSGNPYLGNKAALPPGTTSFNKCGEYYMPLHSHALNEFQNFDEGFGGLATLARIQPPPGVLGRPAGCP